MWKPLWRRLRAIASPRAADRDLDAEIAFHIEEEASKYEREGLSRSEARRRARVAFGAVEGTKEAYRDRRGDRFLTEVARDARYALRVLRRNPGITAAALCTLTLGIGANVALFSIVNAVILRPLPFPAPDRLVALWEDNADKGWVRQVVAPANMLDWESQVTAFEGVAGYTSFTQNVTLTGTGAPRVLHKVDVTGNFFTVLGVRPALGNSFNAGDTWQGGGAKAIISHRLWREQLKGDSSLVGRSITIEGQQVLVAGVMPQTFAFPTPDIDVWSPTDWDPAFRGQVFFRRAHWMRPFARVRAGVPIETANRELQIVMGRLETQFPETNTNMKAGLEDLQSFLVGGTRRPLLVLLGATAILLLIACANVGNLLLVRAAARERESVVRRALGAASRRLVRQAFTESLVLSAIGATLGFAAGWVMTRFFASLMPAGLLPVSDLAPDLRVFVFVASVATVSAILFGIAPAVWSARRAPGDVLKENTRSSSDSRRVRLWGNGLAVGEVALALMLTIGAGLLVRSFWHLTQVDPGFNGDGVLVTNLVLPQARYDSAAKIITFQRQLVERVRPLPGVQSVALTSEVPLGGYGAWTSDFVVRSQSIEEGFREVAHRGVSPEYFRTMQVPLVAGRAFTDSDGPQAEPVVVINQAVANRAFRGKDPIGAMLAFDRVPDSNSVWRRVVGVVGDERQHSLARESQSEIFTPVLQDIRRGTNLLIRTSGNPRDLMQPVTRVLTDLDPQMAAIGMATMAEHVHASLARDRFLAAMLLAFAVVGAGLAVIGVYGVIAQLAQKRTQEIGIRIALGAAAPQIRWLIVRQGLALTSAGVVAGLGVSALLGGTVQKLLHGVSPLDPLTFVVMPLVLMLTGVCAALVPATRATRADPASVLRGSA